MHEAIKRGHLSAPSAKPTVGGAPQVDQSQGSENELVDKYSGHQVLWDDTPVNDDKFCGESNLITHETAKFCIRLAVMFMRDDDQSFIGTLFNPLWQRLKGQGQGEATLGLSWRYEAYRNQALLSRNWCFVPPNSDLGAKGEHGIDHYVSEEEVVNCILKEVESVDQVSALYNEHKSCIAKLKAILSHAVDESMEYKDSRDGKSTTKRTRRGTPLSEAKAAKPSPAEASSTKKRKSRSTSPKPKSTATPNSSKRRKKEESNVSPSFHISQSQRVVAPSFSKKNLTPAKTNPNLPLGGFVFFSSGIDVKHNIERRINRLGGEVVTTYDLKTKNKAGNLFFLSDYKHWRKLKYVCAAALGVPMLHYNW